MIHIEVVMQVANKVRWGSCNLGGWKMTMQDVTIWRVAATENIGKHHNYRNIMGILGLCRFILSIICRNPHVWIFTV